MTKKHNVLRAVVTGGVETFWMLRNGASIGMIARHSLSQAFQFICYILCFLASCLFQLLIVCLSIEGVVELYTNRVIVAIMSFNNQSRRWGPAQQWIHG